MKNVIFCQAKKIQYGGRSLDHLSHWSNLNNFALNLTDFKYKFKKKLP